MNNNTNYEKLLFLTLVLAVFSACTKEFDYEDVFGKDKDNKRTGFVYTMNNDATGNNFLCYKQHSNGSLAYQSSTTSGGAGSGAGLGSMAL